MKHDEAKPDLGVEQAQPENSQRDGLAGEVQEFVKGLNETTPRPSGPYLPERLVRGKSHEFIVIRDGVRDEPEADITIKLEEAVSDAVKREYVITVSPSEMKSWLLDHPDPDRHHLIRGYYQDHHHGYEEIDSEDGGARYAYSMPVSDPTELDMEMLRQFVDELVTGTPVD